VTKFITTAIDYTNAAPHIGHAYEKILADVIARYHRLCGEDVFFLTGVDQHGQKVQQSAQKEGVPPGDFALRVTEDFVALWEKLDISYDGWAATTDPLHKKCVQEILQRLFDEGRIYKAAHAGHYSVRQEQFLTDKERGPDGEFGPEWGEVVTIEEENYYYRLAEHREWLLELLDKRPELVVPSFRLTELRNAVEKLSGDLCISRPKERLAWGIEMPFDPEYVTYVWFDALINYISFAGYLSDDAAFEKRWPVLAHVIGKDILIPAHGVYWPIMLHGLGFTDEQMPPLLVHGYINLGGSKISKSLGNTVDPTELVAKYSAGTLRYYLMRDAATGYDMDFSEERLLTRHNADLANGLGNLLNRSLNMARRYREGKLKKVTDGALVTEAAEAVTKWQAAMDSFAIHSALEAVWNFVARCNAYVEESAPWKMAKDEALAQELDGVLYRLSESLRIIAILISPVLPEASRQILLQLNVTGEVTLKDAAWGGLPDGHQLGEPVPVFPRIEAPAADAEK